MLLHAGRAQDNPFVLGSVHTNIAHLDGASGIVSMLKAVMLASDLVAPSVVHFRRLNPLLVGSDGQKAAIQMGHTWAENVDVRHVPVLIPKSAGPMPCSGSALMHNLDVPTGVSSFGFGGAMAHAIVDSAGSTRTKLRTDHEHVVFKHMVHIPWRKPQVHDMQDSIDLAAGMPDQEPAALLVLFGQCGVLSAGC